MDIQDFADYKMTEFFDRKIYPKDNLSFRSKESWISLFERNQFILKEFSKSNHPWPASRTLFSFQKKIISEDQKS